MSHSGKAFMLFGVLGNIFLLYILSNSGITVTPKKASTEECQTIIMRNETKMEPPTMIIEAGTKEEEAQKKGYIVMDLLGGIGNKMWIYASLYGLAKRSNRHALACVDYNMTNLFPNLSIPVQTKKECKSVHPNSSLMLYQQNNALYYDTSMVQRVQNAHVSHIFICCYLQNLGFFAEFMNELKQEFSLGPSHREKAENYLAEQLLAYRSKNGKIGKSDVIQLVGVHVRRGDMSNFEGINTPPASYFEQAMSYFRQKYKGKVLFIVSSLDHGWCHKNIIGQDVVYTWTNTTVGKSLEEDFSILVSCNHTLMSFGTYGWWAGFFSKGEVVAYKDWAGTSKFAKWFLPGQRFPFGWKLM